MARYGITHHKAISVTSGYWIGAADQERQVINMSGRVSSGTVDLNALAANFDYGTTGFSGLSYGISTRLTSIVAGVATPKYGQGELINSGRITTWSINWSGGAIDLQAAYVNTSTNTSAPACSGILSWIVFGT